MARTRATILELAPSLSESLLEYENFYLSHKNSLKSWDRTPVFKIWNYSISYQNPKIIIPTLELMMLLLLHTPSVPFWCNEFGQPSV